MALNIFEPRYRLLVRRAMAGNRRFGMAAVDGRHELCEASSSLLLLC
jgi:Lon protease-like protein